MQRRITVALSLMGALAGIIALVYLMSAESPQARPAETVEPHHVFPSPPKNPEYQAQRQQGTLKGRVINGVSERPISKAKVIALRPHLQKDEDDDIPTWGQLLEEKVVYTDAAGQFEVADLPPDYWNLWVEKAGYSWTTVPRAKFKETHVIKLYPACSIEGRVVYPDETPAAGIRIEYTPQGTHSEVFGRYRLKDYYDQTDENGYFKYTDLPPGKFTVEVYPDDHLPAPWTTEPPLKPGENRNLGTHVLDDGFGMTVYVKYHGTDEPVPGIEVTVRPVTDPMPRTKTGRRRHTNAEGKAVFGGLGGQVTPDPTFQVVANVPGVGAVQPNEARLFKPDETVTIWIRKQAQITGKVVRPDGQPLKHFFIALEPIGFITRQLQQFFENGEFLLYQVPEGEYFVHVRSGAYIDQAVKVKAVAGQTADIGVVRLLEGAEIRGTVRNASGAALEGLVRVHLAEWVFNERLNRKETRTVARTACRKDGSYTLRGVPPGSYVIWPQNLKDQSRNTEPLPVEVARGVTVIDKDLLIYGEGKLKLTFYDDIEGRVMQVVQPPTFLVNPQTGAEIRWLADGTPIRPGTYDLYVERKNTDGVPKRYKCTEVRIQEGETTGPIEVRLYELGNG